MKAPRPAAARAAAPSSTTPTPKTADPIETGATLGTAAWVMVAELLTVLVERGALDKSDFSEIMRRSQHDGELLANHLPGPVPQRARVALAAFARRPPKRR